MVFLFSLNVGKVRLIIQSVATCKNKCVYKVDCLMHGIQNMCKKAVKDLDSHGPTPEYSTQLQRIANVWRSFGHHKKLEELTRTEYSDEHAKAHFSTSISGVVKSRWGTFEGPERKLIKGLLNISKETVDSGVTLGDFDGSFLPPGPQFLPMGKCLAKVVARPRGLRKFGPELPLTDPEPIQDDTVIIENAADLQPDLTLDWALIYKKALAHGEDGAVRATEMDLAIDGDNLRAIMRIRARKAVFDLSSIWFWIKAMVGHCSRAPFSHGLFALQALKKSNDDGYVAQVPNLFARMLDELEYLLEDEAITHPGAWSRVFAVAAGTDEGSSQVFSEIVSEAEVKDLIFKCVTGNITELLRRYSCVGIGNATAPFWLLIGMVQKPGGQEWPHRAELARLLVANHDLGTMSADGFTEKFIAWNKDELVYCSQSNGLFQGEAFLLLDWMKHVLRPDVQNIESKNSVLRIMLVRAKAMLKDLLSSRHVIKSSDEELVAPTAYTEDLRDLSETHAKNFGERFVHVPIIDEPIPGNMSPQTMCPLKLGVAAKIVTFVGKACGLFDVIVLRSGDVMPRCWVMTSSYRKAKHGLLCDVEEPARDVVVMPPRGLIGTSHKSLLRYTQDFIESVGWPISSESEYVLDVGSVVERMTLRRMRVSWKTISRPFRVATVSTGASSSSSSTHPPLPPPPTYDIEADLADMMDYFDEGGGEDNGDADSGGEADGGGCGGEVDDIRKLPEEAVEAVATVAEQLSHENPMLSAEDAIGMAIVHEAPKEDVSSDSSSSDSDSSADPALVPPRVDADAPVREHVGVHHGGRGEAAHPRTEWEWILCKNCEQRCGQLKLLDGDGRVPTIHSRVVTSIDGDVEQLPMNGPYYKRRNVARDGSTSRCRQVCKTWIRNNRLCCPTGGAGAG